MSTLFFIVFDYSAYHTDPVIQSIGSQKCLFRSSFGTIELSKENFSLEQFS